MWIKKRGFNILKTKKVVFMQNVSSLNSLRFASSINDFSYSKPYQLILFWLYALMIPEKIVPWSASRFSGESNSIIFPWSKTRILSLSRIVLILWAIVISKQSLKQVFSIDVTNSSVFSSILLVGSSTMMIVDFFRRILAMLTSCFSPSDKFSPSWLIYSKYKNLENHYF